LTFNCQQSIFAPVNKNIIPFDGFALPGGVKEMIERVIFLGHPVGSTSRHSTIVFPPCWRLNQDIDGIIGVTRCFTPDSYLSIAPRSAVNRRIGGRSSMLR
jgi:hypothetical protein